MKNFIIDFSFLMNGKTENYNGAGSFDEDWTFSENGFKLSAVRTEKDGAVRHIAKFTPEADVTLKGLDFTVKLEYPTNERVFCNGYQSWTDSREFLTDEKMKGLGRMCDIYYPGNSCREYGDYNWIKYPHQKGCFHSHGYTYVTSGDEISFLGSLNEKSGFTVFQHRTPLWLCVITKDVDGAFVRAGETYELFDIVELNGGYDEVFDKYFELLDIKKPRKKFASGFTSWYNYYQGINEKNILENVENIASGGYGLDIFQIDDGHQSQIGDWLATDLKKFPNGMKTIAEKIREKGMTPGIWLAPLACVKNSKVFNEHPDWIVKGEDGEPYKAGNNWGGFYTLDIYNDGAREYIRNFFNVILKDWGYEMVKLDFLYQQSIFPRNGKTRGELMDDAMVFIRECVGDKLILGCGVPLFPAFGKVDFCRIGCDVNHVFWDGTFVDRAFHRENVSTKRAILTSIYRRHLDGRAFVNDPDVFHLRSTGKQYNMFLNDAKKEVLARVNHMFGSLLFTSDNVGQYTDGQKAKLKLMSKPWDGEIIKVYNDRPFMIHVTYKEDGEEKEMLLDLKKGKLIE